jgi:hypothetical protein
MGYFAEYVLGWKGPSGIKADKGTIVHKVLEIMAKIKLRQQECAIKSIDEKVLDETCEPIDINKVDIHNICEQVFAYYSKHKNQAWKLADFTDCASWVNKVVDFNNGAFNPLQMNIVAPEQHFDITINEPWATYEYDFRGKKLSGCLALKGTIDLITEPYPNTYEIVDWKTGRRLNWATGEEKTHEKLRKDPQLMMYFLAAHYLYPNVDQIMVTINFINDGGPFTMCYTKDDIPETLNLLKKKFEHIKEVRIPKLSKSWKCTKFCHQGKTTFTDTHIKPIIEFRAGQECLKGQQMTKCAQLEFEIARKGIDKVTDEYMAPDHQVQDYTNPGEV